MKHEIEKLNQISQLSPVVVEEAIQAEGREEILIGDVETVSRKVVKIAHKGAWPACTTT